MIVDCCGRCRSSDLCLDGIEITVCFLHEQINTALVFIGKRTGEAGIVLKGQGCIVQLSSVVLAHSAESSNCLLVPLVEYSGQIFFKMMTVQGLSAVGADVTSRFLILIMAITDPVAVSQSFQEGSIRSVTDTDNAAAEEVIDVVPKLQMGRLIFRHGCTRFLISCLVELIKFSNIMVNSLRLLKLQEELLRVILVTSLGIRILGFSEFCCFFPDVRDSFLFTVGLFTLILFQVLRRMFHLRLQFLLGGSGVVDLFLLFCIRLGQREDTRNVAIALHIFPDVILVVHHDDRIVLGLLELKTGVVLLVHQSADRGFSGTIRAVDKIHQRRVKALVCEYRTVQRDFCNFSLNFLLHNTS